MSSMQPRRSPLRSVSARRRRQNEERRVVVAKMIEETPWCAKCGSTAVFLAGHERLARAHGGDITKPDDLLCNPCNEWAESYPILAAWLGWKHSGKYPAPNCISSGSCPVGHHRFDAACDGPPS